MKSVTVKVFGSEYNVRTDDPGRVQEIAGLIDTRMREIDAQFRPPTATRTAVLACLSLLDEHLGTSRISSEEISHRLDRLIEKLNSAR